MYIYAQVTTYQMINSRCNKGKVIQIDDYVSSYHYSSSLNLVAAWLRSGCTNLS